jgi:hypothetical protein
MPKGDRHWSRQHPDRVASGERNGSRTHPEKTPRGERNTQARLTAEKVRDIRHRYKEGTVTMDSLAAEYGVGLTTIWHIIHRNSWRHIP